MIKKRTIKNAILALAILLSFSLSAKTWTVDYKKSSIKFVVDSRFGDVDGRFHDWKWVGKIGSDFTSKGIITIKVASIDTKNEKRDIHLRDPDFFEVQKFPESTFRVDKVTKKGKYYYASGQLSIKKIVKPLKIKFKQMKVSDEKMVLRAIFPINRISFGITYNSIINPIEDEIIMKISLVLIKK